MRCPSHPSVDADPGAVRLGVRQRARAGPAPDRRGQPEGLVARHHQRAPVFACGVRSYGPSFGADDQPGGESGAHRSAADPDGPDGADPLGVPIFLLAVVIALLIPFGNILPVLSLVVLAVALMECDGLVTLIGLLLASTSFVATAALLVVVASAVPTS